MAGVIAFAAAGALLLGGCEDMSDPGDGGFEPASEFEEDVPTVEDLGPEDESTEG